MVCCRLHRLLPVPLPSLTLAGVFPSQPTQAATELCGPTPRPITRNTRQDLASCAPITQTAFRRNCGTQRKIPPATTATIFPRMPLPRLPTAKCTCPALAPRTAEAGNCVCTDFWPGAPISHYRQLQDRRRSRRVAEPATP